MDFVEGNAEELPFPDNSVDLFTIAFGIRNVTNIPRALSEAHRVLKPGGRFMCLEFSHLDNPLLQQVYDAVSGRGSLWLFLLFIWRAVRAVEGDSFHLLRSGSCSEQYSFNVIPALGEVVMNDRAAYQYLVESIRKFPNQRDFARMLRTAGLRGVSYTNFTLGVCAVHSGFKLPAAC